MAFDDTRIAVRERSYLDLLDLGLRVFRVYCPRLVPALAAGVAPLFILNHWLLSGLVEEGLTEGPPTAYMTLMVLLVLYEVPLATAPATLYLGQAVFKEHPGWRAIFRDLAGSAGQLIFFQVVLRVISLRWPYLNEVILLDRNPFWKPRRHRGGTPNTTSSRAKNLHAGEGGDLLGRSVCALGLGGLLFAAVWGSILVVMLLLLNRREWVTSFGTFYWQLSLWIVVGYFTVVRFLSYLDLRIRREGWEVELLLRAEHARLTRRLT